ncbi:Ig-like domain-containing protein [Paenimyroides baculatum]|uniref:T9SS type A sorting domain-containing protein n=1 Tax=Paenimyroides baculatum TaxID=2608000 RepID=A0A5M6CK13_9FLAO|nr:T9SS type A sorting domain-containing protein [Paenimyroides baculatum]KAA5535356.1 T9SS type A sorting domain-containing protein [Paenimyroides baculatum]
MKKITFLLFILLSHLIYAQQDCSSALSICGNSNINYSPIGFGNTYESLGGCLSVGGENNSVWYKFQVATSGTLTFVISPTAAVDYDWAVFGPNVSCANIGTPIRCNAAGTYGNTGLNMTNTNTVGAPGSNVPFCKYMDVIAGETYYLFIDNWVGLGFNGVAPFSLIWGGTATLHDPFLNSTTAPNPFLPPGNAGANTSAPREINLCSNSLLFDFSTLSASILNNNQNFAVSYHTTSNNALSGTSPITSPVTVNTTTTYYYSISYQDPNGSTVSCRQIGAFKFVDKSISLAITASSTNLCPGHVATLTSNIPTGNTWSNGATTQSITVVSGGAYSLTNTNGICTSIASVTINSSVDPNVQIAGNLTFCDGGSTILTASGTGSGLSYVWSTGATTPNITVTTSGSYTVNVTNSNNCTFSKTVVVNQNPLASVQNPSINICSTSATTTFDLTSVQSQISSVSSIIFKYYQNQADAVAQNTNTITNPAAFLSGSGVVYVLVVSGDCSKIATINLTVTLTPTITTQPISKLVCIGGTTSFSATAINAIGYQWQVNSGSGFIDLVNDATYSGVTTNTLTITNATRSLNGYSYKLIVKSNCLPHLDSNTVILSVPEVNATITSVKASCFGLANGSATVVVSGDTTPYTYLWSNGSTTAAISNLAPGTYNVVITDANGCTANKSVVITEPAVISNTLKVKNVSCNGGNDANIEVTSTGGTAPFTYLWSHNNATTATITGLVAGTYNVQVKDANNCIKTEQIIITQPNILTATITSKNVSCNGTYTGEATVNVIGGTAPYTYSWNNGITTATNTGLRPGIFSVTVTDAKGCTVNSSVTITEPTVLTVSTKQTKTGCNGATTNSVIATVTGGTQPYTYLWSNGFTTANADNLLPGTYNLTVTDANGCKVNETVSVVATANLALSFSKKNISCNGLSNGSATAVVTGGKAPFTYNWSTGSINPSINNLGVGTYTLTVTDDYGCTVTETVDITQPDILTATHQQTNVNCYGLSDGSISLTVSGGTAPYIYQWSNGFKTASLNQIPAGTYTVVVTDSNNCALAHTVTITQPIDVPTPTAVNQVFCFNNNATVSNLVVSGTNVKWYRSAIAGTPLNANDLLVAGDYFASQTINGCESFARTGINVVINSTPIPSGYSVQEFCEPFVPKISDLQITGTNIKWYTAAVGGTLLTNASTLVNGSSYYASQTLNGCESTTRFAVKVNVYPNQQLVTGHLAICDVATINDISIEGYTSSQLKWYSSLTAATPLSQSQVLTSGTYYISTFNYNLCESARKAVQIVVSNNVPIPVTSTLQAFCSTATVGDLVATGINGASIKWYNSAQSTTPLTTSTQLFNGTYYVEQEMMPCKSPRIAVAVRVVSSTAPTMTDFKLCEGATVADLYLAGSTTTKYVWYLNGTTTTKLPDTYVLTSGYYYVATESYGCISNRTSVQVQVNTRPSSPTGSLVQNFNYQAKVVNLVMNQPNIVWYLSYNDAVNKMNALDASDLLVDGTTYYGVIVDANSCNSYPTAVKVGVTLGTNDLDLEQLKYYPNPVDSELVISYIDPLENVEIYDVTGKRVFKQKYESKSIIIDFSRFSSGTYMVKVMTAKGSQFIKIIKK